LNRKEPKLNQFRLCFGLFHETKKYFFSVCFGVSNMYRNNRNKHACFETNLKIHLNNIHLQLQRGLDSCKQKCPGASQSSCRQTRTGAATGSCKQTRQGASRSACRQTRTGATTGSCRQTRPVQLKALVSRYVQVQHKSSCRETRPDETQALVDGHTCAAQAAVGLTPLCTA
jgi:hypothetical protein